MKRWTAALALGIAAFAASPAVLRAADPPAPNVRPGDRRAVKNGTDPDAKKVNPTPVKTTVEKLLDIPRPPELNSNEPDPQYEAKRVEPVETTVYLVEADIISHQLMPDGDFLLVLKGETGKTLVVELPDPKRAGPNSRWAKEIAAVRKAFEEKFHPTTERTEVTGRARITAVGFFGRPSPRNAPANLGGVRLQPAIKIEWLEP